MKIQFLSKLILFLLVYTISAYSQWEKVTNLPRFNTDPYWLDVFFLESNPKYGWVCGYYGNVLRTTDGGNTWLGSMVPNAYQLESIHFVSPLVGFTSGMGRSQYGEIYKTTDGGITWWEITDPRAYSLWGNFFLDENNGAVIGGGCSEEMQFFRTSNGGQSWNLFTLNEQSGLTDIILYDQNGLGYASSSGRIWRTLDGGYTWSLFATSGGIDWQEELSHIKNTFLVPYSGECSGGGPGGIRISTDLGRTWRQFFTGVAMFGAFLIDDKRGWACGWEESVYYTSDAGLSWELQNCGIDVPDSLDDMWFINDSTGWLVGSNVYRYRKIVELDPEILANGTTEFCDGDSVILSTKEKYKYYNWSTGETTPSIIVKKSGNYSVIVSNWVCDSAKTRTIKVTVNAKPSPDIIPNGNQSICEGDTLLLKANKTYSHYLWSTGDTLSQIRVTVSGTYTLTVTNEKGCQGSKVIVVNVLPIPKPTIKVNGRAEFCMGESVKLETETGYTKYEWYDKEGHLVKTNSNVYDVTKSGSYYVKVKNAAGCEGISEMKKVSMMLDSNRLEISFFDADSIVYIDSTKILSIKCKDISIKNKGDEPYIIDDIYIFRNVAFSIPQSQFPITIPPKGFIELKVCYSPTVLGTQRDTLLLDDICWPHYIKLESYGLPNYYTGDSHCEVPVYFKTKELNGDYLVTVFPPYPNPSAGIIHIPYSKYLPNDTDIEMSGVIYNSMGEKLFSGNKEILKHFDKTNGYCETGEYIFNTNNLGNGMYLLIFNLNNEIISYPIVIVK